MSLLICSEMVNDKVPRKQASQAMRLSSESHLYNIEIYDLYVLYTCQHCVYIVQEINTLNKVPIIVCNVFVF